MIHIICDSHVDIINILKTYPQLVDEVLSENMGKCDWEDFNSKCFRSKELTIAWNIDLIQKYQDYLDFVIDYSDCYDSDNIMDVDIVVENNSFDLTWSCELIDNFIDKWHWDLFSIYFPIKLTKQLLEKYWEYWNTDYLINSNQEIRNNRELSDYIVTFSTTTITTGKNELYKEKLNNPIWKIKCEKIKKRDHYQCVKCNNFIKELDDFDDIKNYIDSLEIYEHAKELFENRTKKIITTHTVSSLKVKYRLQSGIYLSELGTYPINNPYGVFNQILITAHEPKQPFLIKYASIETSKWFPYKGKESESKFTNKLGLQFSEIGNTNNKYILTWKLDYGGPGYYPLDFRGQGVLAYNQYSIIFPLYQLNEALEVHHKIYKKKCEIFIEPWEYDSADLETLCHVCHMNAHKKGIPIINV